MLEAREPPRSVWNRIVSSLKPRHFLLILSTLTLGAASVGVRHVGQVNRAKAVSALTESLKRSHLALEFGPARDTAEGLVYARSTFRLEGEESVRGAIESVVVKSPLLGTPSIELRGVTLELTGDPIAHFAVLQSMVGPLPSGLQLPPLDVKYTHPAIGALWLRGVKAEHRADGLQLASREVTLLDQTWRGVSAHLVQRGDFLEMNLGFYPGEPAKYQLVYYDSPSQGRVLTLRILHQPLKDALAAIGWQPSSNLAETQVVGSMTLAIHPGESVPRGSLQLTFDNWPKPPWQEADALLGRSASILARIATFERPFDFKLPYVESTLPLFSLLGSGSLKLFRKDAQLLLDLDGTQNCFKFSRNVEPSSYQERTRGVAASSKEETTLHVQLSAQAASPNVAAFAAQLTANCGLQALSYGTFEKLELPARESRRPAK